MAFVLATLRDPTIPLHKREEALERIHAGPGIPTLPTTESFWIQPDPSHTELQQSAALPSETDVVIVGSGITGSSIAQSLLKQSSNLRVIMLEAREICSGATGRNGGHIMESSEDYSEIKSQHGKETAIEVMRFRLSHLAAMIAEAKRLGLTDVCQAREVKFLSIYVDEERWQEAKKGFEEFCRDMPDEALPFSLVEGDVARERYNLLNGVAGVLTGPAGAMWPYKFVTGLLSKLIASFPCRFRVSTDCPVTAISAGNDSILIKTEKGTLKARHVIHCTNAHVSHLLPGLKGRICPIRGQMSAQTPTKGFGQQGREHSWLVNYNDGFDYITQLPCGLSSNGEMMVGGGFAQLPWTGIEEIGVSTDSRIDHAAEKHLKKTLSLVFEEGQSDGPAGAAKELMWTGNMGFSSDGLPWVGKVPHSLSGRGYEQKSKCSEWVCAGFSGEGMVNAWLSGKALAADLMLSAGYSNLETLHKDLQALPKQMKISEERLEKAFIPRPSGSDAEGFERL